MNKLKLSALISLIVLSTSGCAQLTPNEVIGGVAGGIIGNQVGGGTGKTVATAVGAVLGANVGRQIPSPYGPNYPTTSRGIPSYAYPYPGYYSDGTYPAYARPATGCEFETHIDGVYNPPAAQRYCEGRVDRDRINQQRYEQEVYRRGREGR